MLMTKTDVTVLPSSADPKLFEVAVELPGGRVFFKSLVTVHADTHLDGVSEALKVAKRQFEGTTYTGPVGRWIIQPVYTAQGLARLIRDGASVLDKT